MRMKGETSSMSTIPNKCPFCGKLHPYGVEQDNYDQYYVLCDGCGATGPRANSTSGAIERWNNPVMRSDGVKALAELRDELQRANEDYNCLLDILCERDEDEW